MKLQREERIMTFRSGYRSIATNLTERHAAAIVDRYPDHLYWIESRVITGWAVS